LKKLPVIKKKLKTIIMNTENNELIDFGDVERNSTWEKNHKAITEAILQTIREKERFPYKSEIAEVTGLTIRTVYDHLKDYDGVKRRLLNLDMDQFKCAGGLVLSKVMELALEGDLRAARLALQILGIIGKKENKGADLAMG
jgi:hypothetical protein